ncbi:MAG: TorF family putative porin [Gammaproteobacteria bacterium]|nr:TorF family putative porin [Gammaproteobacteria bacterium]
MKAVSTVLAGVAFASCAMVSTSALAEVSYNVGYASEYHFRGLKQKTSSASAGADYESGGFYVGTWAADVGDGLEIDGYFGYGIETEGGFSASVGFTGYYYTGEFDDTYEEVNFNFGFGPVSAEYSVGKYDNFGGPELDYDFAAITAESSQGFYGTIGAFSDDFDGEYLELGYGTSIADFDVGVAAIFASKELGVDSGFTESEESLIISVGKSW